MGLLVFGMVLRFVAKFGVISWPVFMVIIKVIWLFFVLFFRLLVFFWGLPDFFLLTLTFVFSFV